MNETLVLELSLDEQKQIQDAYKKWIEINGNPDDFNEFKCALLERGLKQIECELEEVKRRNE